MPKHVVYNPAVHPVLVKWMIRSGQIEKEIARTIGISLRTFFNWRNQYPEIKQALLQNRFWVDHLVEDSLLKRALGYKFVEEVVVRRPVDRANPTNPGIPEECVVVERKRVSRQMAPDVGACIFWLKNRDPENWRDVLKHEYTGKDAISKAKDKRVMKKLLTDPDALKLANQLARRVSQSLVTAK